MEAFISSVRESDKLTQALTVSAGGLIGVFSTLCVFFLFIAIADLIGKKTAKE